MESARTHVEVGRHWRLRCRHCFRVTDVAVNAGSQLPALGVACFPCAAAIDHIAYMAMGDYGIEDPMFALAEKWRALFIDLDRRDAAERKRLANG